MAKLTEGKLTLKGKSGASYSFNIYSVNGECKDESGIYAFTKRTKNDKGDFNHTVIYIGMAQSFQARFYNHHKDDCIDRNGANCLCLMQVTNEKDRIRIEKDLLEVYNTSCNEVNN